MNCFSSSNRELEDSYQVKQKANIIPDRLRPIANSIPKLISTPYTEEILQ